MTVLNVFGREIPDGDGSRPKEEPVPEKPKEDAPRRRVPAPVEAGVKTAVKMLTDGADREEWRDGEEPNPNALRRIRHNGWKLVVELTLRDDGNVGQRILLDKRRRWEILADPGLVPLSGYFTDLKYRRIQVYLKTVGFSVCRPDKSKGQCVAPASEVYLWSKSDAVEQFLAAMRILKNEGSKLDMKQLLLVGGVTLFVVMMIVFWM